MKQRNQNNISSNLSGRIADLSPAKRTLLQQRLKGKGRDYLLKRAIPRRSRAESAPLSFAQERLWFLDQYEPGATVYNMPGAFRLSGRLDTGALERSLNEIVRRHESLRTTFRSVEGEPRQFVAAELTLPLPVIDLGDFSDDDRDAEVRRHAAEVIRRPFDLSQGPLLRATLLRLGPEEHILLLDMHHIVSDGWSRAIFFRELSALYEAYANGKASPLAELSIQYVDYAVWQRDWLKGEVLEDQLGYWRKQLENISTCNLPTDRPRPAVQTFHGARESLVLSKDLTQALKVLSREEGATLFMTLLAALKILLHRLTGQEDIAVGSPIAGRNRAEIESLIGCFLNTMVLRTKLRGNPVFGELLAQVRGVCLDAYAHQDVPFEKLLEELRPERDLGRTPLFQVFFNMLNVPERVEPAGLAIETVPVGEVESKFDMTIYVRDYNGALQFNWVYNADLFDRDRIREMSRQYEKLLTQISEDPARSIGAYSLLTLAAQELLPNPAVPLAADWFGSVHDRFAHQARSLPDHIAINDQSDSWTYAELNLRSNQLAHYLLQSGIQREEIVAVYAHRSASLVWALLGILKAGAAFLILDPAYPAARLTQYVRAAKPRGLISLDAAGTLSDELESVLQATVHCRVTLPRLSELGPGNLFESYSTADPAIEVGPEDLAYLSYTSGSTGEPNGVQGTHGPLSHFVQWHAENFALALSDRFSLLSGLSHDPALRDIFTPLGLGATLCIPDPKELGSIGDLNRWMKRKGITIAHLTPPMIQLLCEVSSQPGPDPDNNGAPSLLRFAFFGGDILTKQDLSRFQSVFPSATCVNFYGATETPQAMGYFVVPQQSNNSHDHQVTTENIPVGRGIEGVQLLVLRDSRQLAGVGEWGEIHVRTPYLARGYLGNGALTQERFIINPFTNMPGDRVYKTGDKGRYLGDGSLEYIGRTDYQIKVRGFRIELGEIENVLRQNPAVQETVVLACEDTPGDKRLVAYVVAREGQPPAVNDLREFLQRKLPDYMIPSAFVLLNSLPLTPNGKVDRRALPAPDYTQEREETLVAPRDGLELQLRQIWEKVLRVRPIGVRDNFFDLGGHSLLAVRLFAQIEKVTGKSLPVAALFRGPTIEQLARLMSREEWATQWKSLVAIQPGGARPPFFCVHAHDGGILFWRDLARHLGSDQPFYALQAQGLDGREPPHSRIEEMAAHYIKEIRTLQPEGPYFIGGHCIGGLVAFEMAQQLHRQGERVGLLALFDSYAPRGNRSARLSTLSRYRYKTIRLFEMTVGLHVNNLLIIKPHERLAYLREKFNKALYKFYMGLGSAWIPAARRRRSILRAGSQASRNYEPKIYPGKMTLFRATNLGGGIERNPQMGWGVLAGGGLETHLIPGYHAHIVLEPRVRVLATQLIAVLERAQRTIGSENGREEQSQRRDVPAPSPAEV